MSPATNVDSGKSQFRDVAMGATTGKRRRQRPRSGNVKIVEVSLRQEFMPRRNRFRQGNGVPKTHRRARAEAQNRKMQFDAAQLDAVTIPQLLSLDSQTVDASPAGRLLVLDPPSTALKREACMLPRYHPARERNIRIGSSTDQHRRPIEVNHLQLFVQAIV